MQLQAMPTAIDRSPDARLTLPCNHGQWEIEAHIPICRFAAQVGGEVFRDLKGQVSITHFAPAQRNSPWNQGLSGPQYHPRLSTRRVNTNRDIVADDSDLRSANQQGSSLF
jgi:hypothetical protein